MKKNQLLIDNLRTHIFQSLENQIRIPEILRLLVQPTNYKEYQIPLQK